MSERFEQALDRAIDEVELRRAAAGRARLAEDALGGPSDADAERAAFLTRYPFDRFWADLERRDADVAAEERPGWWQRLVAAFASGRVATAAGVVGVALVAGVLWLAGPFGADGVDPSGPGDVAGPGDMGAPGVRFKGPPVAASGGPEAIAKRGSDAQQAEPVGIGFYVRRGDGAVPGQPGQAYREGDQFRFTYWSGTNDYLLVLSVEEDGAVSVYYPDESAVGDAGRSISIARGRNVALEGSVILNDYVGKERFFALFSAEPLSFDEVRAAATEAVEGLRAEGRDLSALERLPIDVPQASFWIEKVPSDSGAGASSSSPGTGR